MRLACLTLLLALSGPFAAAQTPPPALRPAASAAAATELVDGRTNQKIERIRIEDAGSRVDEVRVGGQTQSITVQPKVDVPPYEIVPQDGARGQRQTDGGGMPGKRVWNVWGF
ncbi:MAG: hypothetical protein Q8K38_01460 [Burkholderiaceae bacterium]|nr:hypothetical protein [Burkholderiaceae bacterium]